MANQFMEQMNQQLAVINHHLDEFFSFVGGKLKNFKNLTLGEQISYSVVGLGFLLFLVSIILFIL